MARLGLLSVRWAAFATLGFGEREHSRVLVVEVAAGPDGAGEPGADPWVNDYVARLGVPAPDLSSGVGRELWRRRWRVTRRCSGL